MAEEVFLSEGKLVGRGSTSGVPRTALSGGDELFFTEITTNFTSSSATFIDVTGLTSGAITIPDGPFVLELIAPVFIGTSGVECSIQVLAGSTLLISDTFRAPAANTGDLLHMRTRIPNSMHTPAPGSQVTYKAQVKSSTTASDVSVFVDFAGRLNPCFIRAQRT